MSGRVKLSSGLIDLRRAGTRVARKNEDYIHSPEHSLRAHQTEIKKVKRGWVAKCSCSWQSAKATSKFEAARALERHLSDTRRSSDDGKPATTGTKVKI